MTIQAFRSSKTPYPPTGTYAYTPPVVLRFRDIKINTLPISGHFRPPGMRNGAAESAILGRIKAIAEGRAMTGKGIDVSNR